MKLTSQTRHHRRVCKAFRHSGRFELAQRAHFFTVKVKSVSCSRRIDPLPFVLDASGTSVLFNFILKAPSILPVAGSLFLLRALRYPLSSPTPRRTGTGNRLIVV